MKNRFGSRSTLTFAALFLLAISTAQMATAQDAAQERTFHASKAAVENALRQLHADSGARLPTLEGFASSSTDSLDKFQRGYYDYALKVTTVSPSETTVRVAAKITAWYKGKSAADSGYRVLTSNGRLESDLLDNLQDVLQPAASHSEVSASLSEKAAPSSVSPAVPNAPSSAQQSSILQSSGAIPAGYAQEKFTNDVKDAAAERRAQQLIEQGNALRDILHNQTRPNNLAVIKSAKTPILDRPLDGSKVVLVADAEDEFQIVDTAGEWVHLQVSGISRGWIKRYQVDLPSAATGSLSAMENDPRTFDRPPAFQQTREEISVFPGKWEPLDGKKVKIIWVQPSDKKSFGSEPKLKLVQSVFRDNFNEVSSATPPVAGVVVILDSQDGGMAATTTAALQQWHAGHLPDVAFWKRCLLDPADAFKTAE